MTMYTDSTGSFSASKTATAIYGPYMRAIPTLPVGATNKGQTGIADATSATLGAAGNGWFYNGTTGAIQANCPNSEVDASNKQITDAYSNVTLSSAMSKICGTPPSSFLFPKYSTPFRNNLVPIRFAAS